MKTQSLLNKCIVICFLFVGIIGTFKLNAQFIVGELEYCWNGEGFTVCGHVDGHNATGELNIPESVTYYDGNNYAVTRIGEGAFNECSGLTGTLIIPNSIIEIEHYAFYGCSGFTGSLAIPSSVISIGFNAYYGCSGLTSVSIPASVTTIYYQSFACCAGLTEIIVDSDNSVYDSRGNCNAIIWTAGNELFAGCKNTIIPNTVTSIGTTAFGGCSGLVNISIPNSVTVIGDYAFEDCICLTSIEIPNSVLSIGDMSFKGCSELTSIMIPNSVTTIGYNAFNFCPRLTVISVDTDNPVYDSRNNCNAIIKTADNELYYGCKNTIIPNTVSSIGDYAFVGCSGLTHITIPNSVTTIGDMSFWTCSGLIDIVIPNSITSLGMMAFGRCDGLSSITIGTSVTNIYRDVFMECTGITEISVDSGNPVYDSRDNCNAIIKTSDNELILGSANTIIPNSVTSIAIEAFSYCSGLTYITIPASVTSIGRNPFAYCSGLTAISVDNENPVYDSRDNCNAIIKTADNELISGCKNTIIPSSVTSIGLYAFAGCFWIDKCIIPNTITNIGGGAFYMCSGSNVEITIGISVEYIDDYAFASFSDVTKIEILATTPPNIGSGSLHLFEDFSCPTLIVPCGCVSAYENSAWHNYFQNIIEDCSDVSELESNIASIYPNPTSGIVKIEAENIQNISIYNMLGEMVLESAASGDAFEYDFSNQLAGIYIIRLETAKGVVTKQIAVK